MNKISIETNIGFGLIFSVLFWAAVDGKVPFSLLLMPPIVYTIMYLFIRIFIWDKRRQFNITLSQNAFRKGDLISIGRSEQTGLVLKVNAGVNNQITATLFPLKVTKYKLVNIARLWYVKISYWLRSVER